MIAGIWWNLSYIFGRPRWDTGITPPELVELVESGQVPPGRALDIGCGRGTNAIYLAQRGFQVVGTDLSGLWRERQRYAGFGPDWPARTAGSAGSGCSGQEAGRSRTTTIMSRPRPRPRIDTNCGTVIQSLMTKALSTRR